MSFLRCRTMMCCRIYRATPVHCLHKFLLLTLSILLLWPALALAAGVQVSFSLDTPTEGPFSSNLFTVPDPDHNTGLRVNLPKPDCAVRVTDCQDIDVLNTLDGFNPQPRLSIPFTGPIDVNTVTSDTVFVFNLGSTLRYKRGKGRGHEGNSHHQVTGINQVVWDPDTNTLHVESDELLTQHTRYALVVTNGVRDSGGKRVQAQSFKEFRRSLKSNPTLRRYEKALDKAEEAVKEHRKDATRLSPSVSSPPKA